MFGHNFTWVTELENKNAHDVSEQAIAWEPIPNRKVMFAKDNSDNYIKNQVMTTQVPSFE